MLIKHNGFNQPESPFVAHLVMPDGGVGYAARRRLSVAAFPFRYFPTMTAATCAFGTTGIASTVCDRSSVTSDVPW